MASELGLDLVEISPNATPPVCKIIDYKKFFYEQKKKQKELKARQSKVVVKEIRFGPNTDDHDFEFKVRHAKTFLDEGAKVKAYVNFRGRTIVFKDRGELLLLRFLKELEEVGQAEALPKLEGRRMIVIVTGVPGTPRIFLTAFSTVMSLVLSPSTFSRVRAARKATPSSKRST